MARSAKQTQFAAIGLALRNEPKAGLGPLRGLPPTPSAEVVLDLRALCPQGRHTAGKARGWAIIEDLQQLASPVLLIFDTYEAASGDSQKWIETQLLQRTDRASALGVVIAGQNVPDRGKHAWANAADNVQLQPIREGSDWHEYTQRQGIHISLEEAGLLALAGQGRPGVIYPLLENIARGRQVAGRG